MKGKFRKKDYVFLIIVILLVIYFIFFFGKSPLKNFQEDFFEIEKGMIGRNMNSLLDIDDLILEMNDSRFVLLGESTHGTEEYYLIRKHVSKKLIEDFGFNFIAVEGDWASIYELNKYVKLLEDSEESAEKAMSHLDRWPIWMWNNEVILDLIEWMREYNKNLPIEKRVGFYGIDVYSPMDSYDLLNNNLKKHQEVSKELNDLHTCFSEFYFDFNNYPGFVYQTGKSCDLAIDNLIFATNKINLTKRENFKINQELSVLKNAEKHYRYMIYEGYDSWNIRASHFALTVENIANYYGDSSRGIIWAHNTHVGDSSFVIGADNMLNIGKILREKHDVFILGFVKNTGKVSAGNSWGSEMQIMTIPSAKEGSYGKLFSEYGLSKSLFIFNEDRDYVESRNHRAIGVVYDPLQEWGNYVPTKISKRYDAVIFINETNELLPLN